MARLKYDGYRDFRAGMRFIEGLVTWLRQFKLPQERETACEFVRLHSFIEPHDTCPLLPFPATDPRIGDALAEEYLKLHGRSMQGTSSTPTRGSRWIFIERFSRWTIFASRFSQKPEVRCLCSPRSAAR